MIDQIQNVPSNMIAFRASGEVTKEDFDKVLSLADAAVKQNGKLNYLLQLDTSPGNFTIGAWMQDALLGIKNLLKWNRAAIVSDSETVIKFTDVFSKLMPGEFRGYKKEELQEAIDWTSEKTN